MPQLAQAWITLTATTKGMEGDVRRALQRAENSVKLNPKVNTSALGAQGSRAGREFGDNFSSSAKSAMKALAAVTIGAGIVDQFKKVMSVGMDWTNNMNTLQAVTGATTAQLEAAGKAARALGNDVSLPATSANDAASAMTELAKGGFTVQESMDAAKGSLQLAAAAQISATQAATIQSQALQAFGLNAGDAGKMADTLANAANASSAEITDVAQAMAQAGTVANQFKLSAEDTAATIGLLANNGIKGSDAGTLLKSALLALTDQSKPAQGAIKELGLTVYDAKGKFEGVHNLFEQLGNAAKRMTDEEYQAATATLFGSDAMRLAGVASKDGSAGYDKMRAAIDRQGAAADVAAAKTKGLPGAWERVKNSIESLQLNAYDVIEGPLTRAADGASKVLGDLPDKAKQAWKELTANPAIKGAVDATKDAFKSLLTAGKGLAPVLMQNLKTAGTTAGTLGVAAWQALVTALKAASGVVQILTPPMKLIADVMAAQPGLVTAAAGAWLAFKTVPGVLDRVQSASATLQSGSQTLVQRLSAARSAVSDFGSTYRTHLDYLRQANPNISAAAANLKTLQSAAGAGLSGVGGALKSAAGGLMGAVGGPWGGAIFAATGLIGALGAKHAEAAESARRQIQAEGELRDTLDASTAIVTAATRENVAKKFTQKDDKGGPTVIERAQSLGVASSAVLDASTGTGDPRALDYVRRQAIERGVQPGLQSIKYTGDGGEQVDYKAIIDYTTKLGISSDQLQAALLKQGTAWDDVNKKLRANDPAGNAVVGSLQQLIDRMPDANESFITLAQAVEQQRNSIANGAAAQRDYIAALNGTWVATQEGVNRFRDLGASIVAVPDGKTVVVDALTKKAEDTLTGLGYKVEHLPNGQFKVTADTDEAKGRIAALVQQVKQPTDMPVQIRILNRDALNLPTRTADKPVDVQPGSGPRSSYAFGAIAMAGGGLRQIAKPRDADIYAGRGAGTVFAEQETGGEAYIPLAAGKRGRSKRILSEVARLFGMNVMADGGITVEALKQYASQLSGGGYVRGGPADLGGTDCSGAQAAVANFITGGSGRFSTADEARALMSRGFQMGDPPPNAPAYWIGWRNGGPGGGHTAGTIVDPEGGNVNVEMGGANGGGAFGGGAAGAAGFPNRAWIQLQGGEDPNTPNSFSGGSSAAVQSASAAVTRSRASVTSAQASLDQANAAVSEAKSKGKSTEALEKKRDAAQQRLDAAQQRQGAAETRLSEVTEKAANSAEKGSGGMDGQSLGQGLFSGLLQGIGLDGSLFSNPLEWPNLKTGMAVANFGGGLLKQMMGGGQDTSGTGSAGPTGGLLAGAGLPGLSDLLQPVGPQATTPMQPIPDAPHAGSGAAPGAWSGPFIQVNGDVGKDFNGFRDGINHQWNQSLHKNLSAVRPG